MAAETKGLGERILLAVNELISDYGLRPREEALVIGDKLIELSLEAELAANCSNALLAVARAERVPGYEDPAQEGWLTVYEMASLLEAQDKHLTNWFRFQQERSRVDGAQTR